MNSNAVKYWGIVFDVLIEHADANPEDKQYFIAHCIETPKWREWRFKGLLGFGGKIWHDAWNYHLHVNCYPEDETPERLKIIKNVNKRLEMLDGNWTEVQD